MARFVPVANVCRFPIGCPGVEIWWEGWCGFVRFCEAWTRSLTGATIEGLFGAAFVVGDRGWVLGVDERWWVGSIVGQIGSAVSCWSLSLVGGVVRGLLRGRNSFGVVLDCPEYPPGRVARGVVGVDVLGG